MLPLIDHIVRISARRDRTEVNQAFNEALWERFAPSALTLYRCYPHRHRLVVHDCAGLGEDGLYCRNAYLPERRHCQPVDQDAWLNRCAEERSLVVDQSQRNAERLILPVFLGHQIVYFVDITLPGHLSADRRVLLLGLVEYFGNHVGLLDYGETDTLTGLSNRKTFDKHLFEVLGQAAGEDQDRLSGNRPRRRQSLTRQGSHWLAVCDIDHFKRVNDTYGHLMGDEVLVTLAHLMRDCFRFEDQLFRFGGEEFIIVLQPTDAAAARMTLERLRLRIEGHPFNRIGQVTLSIGYSQLQAGDTPPNVIDRADEALYYAKENGRNRVAHYEALMSLGAMQPKQVDHGEIELF